MGDSVIGKSENYPAHPRTARECVSFQIAFKDTYDKSTKSELRTSQGGLWNLPVIFVLSFVNSITICCLCGIIH